MVLLHGRLGHGMGRIAVQVGDPLAQGTVVQADADGGSMLLADLDEFRELAAGLRMVRGEIARIDPHLLHIGRHGNGRRRREMNVRDQRGPDAQRAQTVADRLHVRHILQARTGDPDQAGPGLTHPQALLHGSFHIVRMGIAHGLRDNRMSAADRHLADPRCHSIHRWEGLKIISRACRRSCRLVMPVRFDIFGMQPEGRKTIARMAVADIQHGLDGRDVNARHDHRLHALFTLARNDLFTVGIKSRFVYMTVSVNHFLLWQLAIGY